MKYDLGVSRIVHSKHINSQNSKTKTAKSALENVLFFVVIVIVVAVVCMMHNEHFLYKI